MTLLEVRNLAVSFYTEDGIVEAVRNISFCLSQGDALGIIGESGCGKTVTALSLMGLLPINARIVDGEILFKGTNILDLKAQARARLRGSGMVMVFQDALSSLNPVFTIGEQVRDILSARTPSEDPGIVSAFARKDLRDKIISMLREVGISSPERRITQYVHELSGGMRQRVMIAMALCCRPEILIADEPTTALDVTTEAQVVKLIGEMAERFGVSVILITHNLNLVADICNRGLIVYRGYAVEDAPLSDLLQSPLHPYTQGLMSSVLTLDVKRGMLKQIKGRVPSPMESIRGCQFNPRCPHAMDVCSEKTPPLIQVEAEHKCACFLYGTKSGGRERHICSLNK